jgi:hypothetical protein
MATNRVTHFFLGQKDHLDTLGPAGKGNMNMEGNPWCVSPSSARLPLSQAGLDA